MININHVRDIRTCERIKFDQALYILTMYEKKIRVRIKNDSINAEQEYENVINSWKSKWKADLTKPILNCVTSVPPRLYLDDDIRAPPFAQYNKIMSTFFSRLRIEHEDETNFKLIQMNMQKQIKNSEIGNVQRKISMYAVKQFFKSSKRMLEGMSESIRSKKEMLDKYQIQPNENLLEDLENMTNLIENLVENNDDLVKYQTFTSVLIGIFDNIKESKHGSTLLSAQPFLGEGTHIFHPLLPSIYAYFQKQRLERQCEKFIRYDVRKQSYEVYQRKLYKEMANQLDPQKYSFKQSSTSSTQILPKIVLINLDGYESQFNLEFARCMRKNLMYISFLKEDVHSENDLNEQFERRLYKKIMYQFSKSLIDFEQDEEEDEEIRANNIKFSLEQNQEDYYKQIQQQLYDFPKGIEDMNKNIFIYPLRLPIFHQHFNQLIQDDDYNNIDASQSHLIYQIMWYFMINQIREFNPTLIMVSYSGRLKIQNNHFVEIIQQLTKLANYKLLFFPNLTAQFFPPKNTGHQFRTNHIGYTQNLKEQFQMKNQDNLSAINYDMFDKIARFLKISSGTHNLTRLFEEDTMLSKYKHQLVLTRMNRLMEALGKEYENVERIRFKDRNLELIPKLHEEEMRKILKQDSLANLIPKFYNNLYVILDSLIRISHKRERQEDILFLSSLKTNPNDYRDEIFQLVDYLKSQFSVRHISDSFQREQTKQSELLRYLKSFKEHHFIEVAEQKYEDEILIYFKMKKEKDIYKEINNPQKQFKNNFEGLVEISFASPIKDMKEKLQLFQTASILYKTNQMNSRKFIPILIMNHLALNKNLHKFQNYCSFVQRGSLAQYKNDIHQIRNLKLLPIRLHNNQSQEIEQNYFRFRTDWNYLQTSRYMILYWPALFDFVTAACYRIQGRTYKPPLLNQFYFSLKINEEPDHQSSVNFYCANLEDTLPRSGCSGYEINDQIYLFGGSYGEEKNYLNLQTEITRIDLSQYNHTEGRKLKITNEKSNIYPQSTQKSAKLNSYVRNRRQFQFFDLEELVDGGIEQQMGKKKVVMIGGYGENFLRPFSLLTYYYYLLTFDQNTSNLLSIEKKIIYERTLLINTKDTSKNLGIIKTYARVRNQNNPNQKIVQKEKKLSDFDAHCRYRSIYSMEKTEEGYELGFKYKFIFSEKDMKNPKEELRSFYEQQKNEISELGNITNRFERSNNGNHHVFMEKSGMKKMIHLRLEKLSKTNPEEKHVALTHESIPFISIINGVYICAIIKHSIFTKGKSIIADCHVKSMESENLSEEQIPFITLKQIINFDLNVDLSLHIIEASNPNFIFILHGYQLYPSQSIREYQVKNIYKQGKKQCNEILPNTSRFQNGRITRCFSTFFYKQTDNKNQIICESYFADDDSPTIKLIEEKLSPSSELAWKNLNANYKPRQLIFEVGQKPQHLERMHFTNVFKSERKTYIVLKINKRSYIAVISERSHTQRTEKIQLHPQGDFDIQKYDQELEGDKGTILEKTMQRYNDLNFESKYQL